MDDADQFDELDDLCNHLITFLDNSNVLGEQLERQGWIERCLPAGKVKRLQPRQSVKRDDITFILKRTQGEGEKESGKLLWLKLWKDQEDYFSELDTYPLFKEMQIRLEEYDRKRRENMRRPGIITGEPSAGPEDFLPSGERGEWLRAWGFSIDPFDQVDGSRDKHLLKYYWPMPDFQKIADDNEPVFVFGQPGSGKSTMRNAVALKACQNQILTVVFRDFLKLIGQKRRQGYLVLENYLNEIIYFTCERLIGELKEETKPADWDSHEELRNQLVNFIMKYQIKTVTRKKLIGYLDPTNIDEARRDEDLAARLLDEFCSLVCTLFGYNKLYFLVDPDETSTQLKWDVLVPLISEYHFLRSEGDHFAFRFFLDESYLNSVQGVEWIKDKGYGSQFEPLNWDEETLLKILEERLSKCSKGKFTRLDALSDGLTGVDQKLINRSQQSPRSLIRLCNRLFDHHVRHHGRYKAFIQDDLDAVLPEETDPQIGRLVSTILEGRERPSEKTIKKIIQAVVSTGENQWVELKATLFADIRDQEKRKEGGLKPKEAVMREIVALANTEGGIVIIGIEDDGSPCGLSEDLKSCKTEDSFRRKLNDAIDQYLPDKPSQGHQIYIYDYLGVRICAIVVPKSAIPVYLWLRDKDEYYFFKREDNQVKPLDVRDAVKHMKKYFNEICPVCGSRTVINQGK